MGTSSNRSAGAQITKQGPVQGNALVDPNSGYPVDVIQDGVGKRRLAVDANLTADNITVDTRELRPSTDQVAIGDKTSGNFLKVNADGSINVDVILDSLQDNIGISDQTTGDKLKVNPDGSINIDIMGTSSPGYKSIYNEILSVASEANTIIQTYVVPVGKTTLLQKVVVSGDNIASYTILINSIIQDKKRTYFGDSLNTEFDFSATAETGLPLISGDILQIKVIHSRPAPSDFNSRIQIVES